MKNHLIKTCALLAAMSLPIASALAQNTFPASGNVGIGTTTPNATITVLTNGNLNAPHQMRWNAYNATTTGNNGGIGFLWVRANGTNTAPTALALNDRIAYLSVGGRAVDGSNQFPAGLEYYVDGIPSTNNVPTGVRLKTGTNATTSLSRFSIASGGAVTLSSLAGTGTRVVLADANGTLSAQSSSGTSGAWLLGGNAGTNPTSNFMGTTDNQDVIFKRNNVRAGFLAGNSTSWGVGALGSNNTGIYNTAIGRSALGFNTTGYHNTATGYGALILNTIGYENTANGAFALYFNTTGYSNTANGSNALYNNTIGYHNTANGTYALYNNTEGNYNAATGANALYNNTEGNYNAATGVYALRLNTTGFYNTANGVSALLSNTTGNGNTGVGFVANVSTGTFNNATAIGNAAIVNASDKVVIGQSIAGTVIGGYANWSNLSDGRFKEEVKEDVPGMAFISQLRPVTYVVNVDKLQKHITAQMPDSVAERYYPSPEQIALAKADIRTGFIAQEVEAAAQKIRYTFDGVNAPTNPTDNYSLEYAGFVPSMVKGMQEQQQVIEQLTIDNEQMKKDNEQVKKDNEQLKSENQEIKGELADLKALVNQLLAQNNPTKSSETTHSISLSAARLGQNYPNPLDNQTTIEYYLPSETANARLEVMTLEGKVITSLALSASGEGKVSLETRNLASGSYLYRLLINEEVIDSKKMSIQH